MKLGLFMLSVVGLVGSGYFIIEDLSARFDFNHLIYMLLLLVMLCNCLVGIMMTYPEVSGRSRRKFRLSSESMFKK